MRGGGNSGVDQMVAACAIAQMIPCTLCKLRAMGLSSLNFPHGTNFLLPDESDVVTMHAS